MSIAYSYPGVRHFAESETLDHLPLTDPENFGTPVLSFKRKPKRKTTLNAQNETDGNLCLLLYLFPVATDFMALTNVFNRSSLFDVYS